VNLADTFATGNGLQVGSAIGSGGGYLGLGGGSTGVGGIGTLNVRNSGVTVLNPYGEGVSSIVVGRAGDSTAAGIGTLNMIDSGNGHTVVGVTGSMLIGAGAYTIGTVNVGAGARLETLTIGVAHDGTANTGGIGTLNVNGIANAVGVVIGSAGVLTGSGVINGNVTNYGTINPGNSPGRLTINGGLDSSGGKIVLEVESLGNNQFAYDEIVLGDLANVSFGGAQIEFSFLGATDPLAFQRAGLFDLGSFFLVGDGQGGTSQLSTAQRGLFDNATFSAVSPNYTFDNFQFNPYTGVTAVPEPASLQLALLGLALMAGLQRLQRRRS
jgi:hypothetical protein